MAKKPKKPPVPAEFVIEPKVVVSRKTGEEMLRRAAAKPTAALRRLMRGSSHRPS